MRYFRQALAMMREERLFSGIYISGTALAIAFTMLIAEVYYVKVADITDEVSDLLFGRGADAVGKTISVSNFDFRVCGVVETPSALMEASVADVWMPYTTTMAFSGWEVNWQETPIDVTFSVPAAKREAFMQEMKEVEARYNSVHKASSPSLPTASSTVSRAATPPSTSGSTISAPTSSWSPPSYI